MKSPCYECPEYHDVVRANEAERDLVSNIAALDELIIKSADVNLLRSTLRDWRDTARNLGTR